MFKTDSMFNIYLKKGDNYNGYLLRVNTFLALKQTPNAIEWNICFGLLVLW